MLLDRPFMVVTPTVDGDVLAVLAGADALYTAPRVHELIGEHSVSGVRNALQRLAGQGIVTTQQAGNAILYGLNREHLAASAVIELARLRSTLLARIEEVVSGWAPAAVLVAVFGSVVSGDMAVRSDIDLFVVRQRSTDPDDPTWRSQVSDLEQIVRAWTGNDARVLEYSSDDLGNAIGHDPVIDAIARSGVVVFGDARLLRRARRDP